MGLFKKIITAAGEVTAYLKDKSRVFTFNKNHPQYDVLIEAMENDDEATFLKTLSIGSFTQDWSMGHFTFNGENLCFKGVSLEGELENLILDLVEEGHDYRPFLRFLNKAYTGREGLSEELFELRMTSLWKFLRKNKMPIVENGDFLGFKYVQVAEKKGKDKMGNKIKPGDFVDAHNKGDYRYNPGDKPRMLLNEVCTDLAICAGSGLHVGNRKYVRDSSSRKTVLVSVNPAHVVVCPSAETCKVRTTGFNVLRQLTDLNEEFNEVYYFQEEDVVPDETEDMDFNFFNVVTTLDYFGDVNDD